MLELETIMSKYGEVIVFHLLEKWEQHKGIRQEPLSIKERWNRFIQETDFHLIQTAVA